MTKKDLLASSAAADLREHLEKMAPSLRDRALRYYLEYLDKGVGVLKRRENKRAAKWVLEAVETVEAHVAKDQREAAFAHIRRALFEFAQKSH